MDSLSPPNFSGIRLSPLRPKVLLSLVHHFHPRYIVNLTDLNTAVRENKPLLCMFASHLQGLGFDSNLPPCYCCALVVSSR